MCRTLELHKFCYKLSLNRDIRNNEPTFCAGAIAVPRRFYGEPFLDSVVSDVVCTGNENKLLQCNSSTMFPSCTTLETDAGVVCQAIITENGNCSDGDIRLVNGTTILEGRVEICINNAWGTVCDRTFSEDVANVICNQTGYRYNGKLKMSLIIMRRLITVTSVSNQPCTYVHIRFCGLSWSILW